MNGQHGTSIGALLVLLYIAWGAVAVFYLAAGARRLSTRRTNRRRSGGAR